MSRVHKKICRDLLGLGLDELLQVDAFIHERIEELENFEPPVNPAREVVERKRARSGGYLVRSLRLLRGPNILHLGSAHLPDPITRF